MYYKNLYGKLAYGNLKDSFIKINNLKNTVSSNFYRKKYILKNINIRNKKLLDFGSGMGIFPYSVKKICKCYFYDKNKLSIDFCKKYLKLNYFNFNSNKKNLFDFITCNKVLEHMNLSDIIKTLKKFKKLLKKNGKIYIEVPSYLAKNEGYKRQEFFSEHINVFSKNSAKKLFEQIDMKIVKSNYIKEINNKYTLRIILQNEKKN